MRPVSVSVTVMNSSFVGSRAAFTRPEPPKTTDGRATHEREPDARLARVFCLSVGPALALNGLLGLLFAGAELEVGDSLPHHRWNFFFEFNGWHELLHVATGLMLSLVAFSRRWARVGALAF